MTDAALAPDAPAGESSGRPPLRILEIGPSPYVQQVMPDATRFVATGSFAEAGSRGAALRLGDLRGLWRMVHGPDFDLIICRPPFFAPWQPSLWLRALFNRKILRGDFPLARAFASQLLRGRPRAPLAIVDQEDVPYIHRHNRHLLDASTFWFKRELPIDHWRVFQRTGHRDLPTPRFRTRAAQLRRVAKLRPISIGLPRGSELLLPAEALPKQVDIFFAGLVEGSSTIRPQGLRELRALREEGVTVDIAEGRLTREEFYARMARARLVWSPEGLGWDCFRHYEAGACFAVPLISRAPIHRHAALQEGAHAFYYDAEPGGLTQMVRAALADPARLDAMAQAARSHVLEHHTPAALVRHVVETVLGSARASGPSR